MYKTKAGEFGWESGMDIKLSGKIKQDLKTAMLNRDNEVRDTIRLVMGEYPGLTIPITLESGKKTTRVKKPEEITNEDLQGIIQKLAKSEKTVMDIKKQDSSEYLKILEAYLPKMADEENITLWIKENVDFSKFKNSMQAMGTIMKHFGKTADGNLVKKILQER